MAAYTLAEFITHASAGDPILITLNAAKTDAQIDIGDQSIVLTDGLQVRTVDGNKNVNANVLTTEIRRTLDLGTKFTANQVLESESLRLAIEQGLVLATAGTQALSPMVVA